MYHRKYEGHSGTTENLRTVKNTHDIKSFFYFNAQWTDYIYIAIAKQPFLYPSQVKLLTFSMDFSMGR